MKTQRLFRFLPLLAIAGAAADTFELKDGSVIEGTILGEDGSDYIVQVQVTKSIKDERRIPKADVVKQTAEKKDETAFAEITKLVPTPDLQTAETYQKQIRSIHNFVKNHPNSPKKADALKVLSVLDKEFDVVEAGGVKFQGKLISAAERAPRAYALDAAILAATVAAAAEQNDLLDALRRWSELETRYPGSTAYVETIPLAVRIMKSQLAAVTATLAGFDARTKARTDGLAAMSSGDRSRSDQAIKDELADYQARVEREKAAGIKWPSLNPYVKQPLEETKRHLENEIRRYSNFDPTHLPKSEAAYEEAYSAVTKAGATKPEIEFALSKARGSQIPQEYIDLLVKAAPATPAP